MQIIGIDSGRSRSAFAIVRVQAGKAKVIASYWGKNEHFLERLKEALEEHPVDWAVVERSKPSGPRKKDKKTAKSLRETDQFAVAVSEFLLKLGVDVEEVRATHLGAWRYQEPGWRQRFTGIYAPTEEDVMRELYSRGVRPLSRNEHICDAVAMALMSTMDDPLSGRTSSVHLEDDPLRDDSDPVHQAERR